MTSPLAQALDTLSQFGSYIEVTSNGETTWVNTPSMCLARHCPLSGEVFEDQHTVTVDRESYQDWCLRVKVIYGYEINHVTHL